MPRQEWKRWGGGVKEEVKWVIGNCQGTMSSSIFSNIEVSEGPSLMNLNLEEEGT
jgi:hypothetical protein